AILVRRGRRWGRRSVQKRMLSQGQSFGHLANAAHQLRETRFAESLLDGVVRGVEDWAKPSFHRAGHHASLMHLAAHRKDSALAFNRLVDLAERDAGCAVSETDAAVAALAKRDESLALEELEDLPHHDRVGLEAFRDFVRSRPRVAGARDETHDVDGARQTSVRGHKQNCNSYSCVVKLGRCVRPPRSSTSAPARDRARRAAGVSYVLFRAYCRYAGNFGSDLKSAGSCWTTTRALRLPAIFSTPWIDASVSARFTLPIGTRPAFRLSRVAQSAHVL